MGRDESIARSLLMGLSNDGLENVLSAFQPRSFEAGSMIVQAGDPGDELFLITAGRVRVWSGDGPAVAERTLSMMGPGEHFGEASVISGSPRSATVSAITYVEAMVLSGDDYRRLVKSYPELLENVTRSLTSRLSQMNVARQSGKQPKRGLHSLAVIVQDDAGWRLAESLIATLRSTKQIVQPILLCDQPEQCPQDFDRDALRVQPSELGITIAERIDQSLSVTIASGVNAASAAVQECNRIVFAVSASKGLAESNQSLFDKIPPHRRPVVALMFDGDGKTRPNMNLQESSVRCRHQGNGLNAKFATDGVMRLYRHLAGRRIGLALGGGGARGIAHIGVLEVFQRAGVVFDSIAGTSAGAIVTAAVGLGFKPAEVGDFFRQEMVPPSFMAKRSSTRRIFLLHSFRGGRFETKLRRYMGELTFQQADLPLSITTLDLISGEQQIRRDGDLVQAVLQSINHPVFGRPIIQDGQMLVDGGVLMNVPASVLRSEGCDQVISIDVGSTITTDYGKDRKGNLKKPSYFSTLLRAMDISRRHCSALHREESDLIIIPQTSDFRIEDFHAVDALIDAGREAGEKAIDNVKRLVG
ncbi:patatin-like phospholipase family protein [Stieleria sp. JC731]|uniref:patatin-like phospholipase family protein n=1 Tax=Pirellulaceae TaxID=2691357 RepID=UPI001E55920F|nr:cyclic nucleotide-binding and patatin-like phospholipase domain-containing protein [Stieleria sp. JC731]MCC9603320.1 patatin-like phospholipase family protein [Stieleria sp. JC731]